MTRVTFTKPPFSKWSPEDVPMEIRSTGMVRHFRNTGVLLSPEALAPDPNERKAVAQYMAAQIEEMERETVVRMREAV